jgi:LDH2 family malate/lactate/ureidoglycolate dehydrogenase
LEDIFLIIINEYTLREIATDILRAVGTKEQEAAWVADCLVLSNLKGVDSHGIQQISGYVKAIKEGFLKPGAEMKLLKDREATSYFDGGWGFGYSIARDVMKITIMKAKKTGVSYSVIRNIHHIGRVGRWAEMALEDNMMGIASQPGGVYTAPWGGIDKKLPIAPIAFAVPSRKYPPIVIDMSLGPIAGGRTSILALRNKKVHQGWFIDEEGNPINDPKVFHSGKGAQLPLGQIGLGYKGMALSMIIDILTGPLLGLLAEPGFHAFKRRGVFLGAIDIEAFTEIDDFIESIDSMITDLKSSRLAEGFDEILIPGEPEWREMEYRKREGIPLDEAIFNNILDTINKLGLDPSKYEIKKGKLEINHPSYTLKQKYVDR